jgi:hypothetical protein
MSSTPSLPTGDATAGGISDVVPLEFQCEYTEADDTSASSHESMPHILYMDGHSSLDASVPAAAVPAAAVPAVAGLSPMGRQKNPPRGTWNDPTETQEPVVRRTSTSQLRVVAVAAADLLLLLATQAVFVVCFHFTGRALAQTSYIVNNTDAMVRAHTMAGASWWNDISRSRLALYVAVAAGIAVQMTLIRRRAFAFAGGEHDRRKRRRIPGGFLAISFTALVLGIMFAPDGCDAPTAGANYTSRPQPYNRGNCEIVRPGQNWTSEEHRDLWDTCPLHLSGQHGGKRDLPVFAQTPPPTNKVMYEFMPLCVEVPAHKRPWASAKTAGDLLRTWKQAIAGGKLRRRCVCAHVRARVGGGGGGGGE